MVISKRIIISVKILLGLIISYIVIYASENTMPKRI